jgi:hypothetical protein
MSHICHRPIVQLLQWQKKNSTSILLFQIPLSIQQENGLCAKLYWFLWVIFFKIAPSSASNGYNPLSIYSVYLLAGTSLDHSSLHWTTQIDKEWTYQDWYYSCTLAPCCLCSFDLDILFSLELEQQIHHIISNDQEDSCWLHLWLENSVLWHSL